MHDYYIIISFYTVVTTMHVYYTPHVYILTLLPEPQLYTNNMQCNVVASVCRKHFMVLKLEAVHVV